jgi:hypothetical protein
MTSLFASSPSQKSSKPSRDGQGAVTHSCRNLLTLLRAILDEIFDQSAYRRHLSAHNLQHSGPEWRKFQDHHLSAKSRRARCC